MLCSLTERIRYADSIVKVSSDVNDLEIIKTTHKIVDFLKDVDVLDLITRACSPAICSPIKNVVVQRVDNVLRVTSDLNVLHRTINGVP